MMLKKISIAIALACASQAYAADTEFDNFTPLTGSQVSALPAATPILLSSPNFSQVTIADRATQNAQVPGSNSGNWDMVDADSTGHYLFMPFETGTAGVQRIDLQDTNYNTRTVTIVAPGTQGFVSGDASRTTPWGGYLTAEESWGTGSTKGRLFEVTNPTTAVANGGNFVQRSVIPRVSHEGLAFDDANNLYFIDEQNGGSIYKYTSANPNATNGNDYFAAGQTFAAIVNGGNNNVSATGNIVWSAITNSTGGALAGVSTLLGDGTIDGRASANTLLASNYQRPEDTEIVKNASGEEMLYFTTTTTNEVFSFNLNSNVASLFASIATTDLATGLAVGSTAFTSPDNLAFDSEGNLYIIEDRNGAVDDDIWFAKDVNHDGDLNDAGEGLARWASNGTPGSEFTGLYFDKNDPNKAYVNIQHPNTGIDRMIQISAVTPVPEPETYAMMLAGLGMLGAFTRRRKQSNPSLGRNT